MKQDTIDGLRDTHDDLLKQLEKAEDKYQTLLRRSSAVQDAIIELEQSLDESMAQPDAAP